MYFFTLKVCYIFFFACVFVVTMYSYGESICNVWHLATVLTLQGAVYQLLGSPFLKGKILSLELQIPTYIRIFQTYFFIFWSLYEKLYDIYKGIVNNTKILYMKYDLYINVFLVWFYKFLYTILYQFSSILHCENHRFYYTKRI